MAKFALLSHVLPPSPSGQAVMLYRILSGIGRDEYYLISTNATAKEEQKSNDLLYLSAPAYLLPEEPILKGTDRFWIGHLREIINITVRIYTRARNVTSILRLEPSMALIIACSGDLVDIPAGFLASRITHTAFYAYIFDDYVYQWSGKYRLFARLVAPYIFKHSAGIIGPNEFICEEYRRRYHVTPTLVRNPCDKEELEEETLFPIPSGDGKIKIVYTGAVYHANIDCFRNLIQAMASLQAYLIELHIFTAQTCQQLTRLGIQSEQVFIHSHVPYHNILEQQRSADILFLPLAFESPIPEVIRTSAPGKMGEYLASKRPVLVHAPEDSFVAWYFRRYECGVVVSKKDPVLLAEAIQRIVQSTEFQNHLTANAFERARADFDPQVAREKFVSAVNGSYP